MKVVSPLVGVSGLAAVVMAAGCGSGSHSGQQLGFTFPAGNVSLSQPLPSPDGKLIAQVKAIATKHNGPFGYLLVGPKGRLSKVVYWSRDACCANPVWASNRLIVFDDDYRVLTLDTQTRRRSLIAHWSNFVVSKNGHLVAGYAGGGPREPQSTGVVSIDGRDCRYVPKPTKFFDDSLPSFSKDGTHITIVRRAVDPKGLEDTGPSTHPSFPISALTPPPPKHSC
jgi:hypothetical protein